MTQKTKTIEYVCDYCGKRDEHGLTPPWIKKESVSDFPGAKHPSRYKDFCSQECLKTFKAEVKEAQLQADLGRLAKEHRKRVDKLRQVSGLLSALSLYEDDEEEVSGVLASIRAILGLESFDWIE